jgi:flagellin
MWAKGPKSKKLDFIQNGRTTIMATVNTNVGAMIALQSLNKTTRELGEVQGRITTGLSVANAKDNGALFAIAQNMRGKVAGFSAVQQSLSRGVSTVDVALAAGEAISDLLIEMKGKAVAAADSSLDATSRAALNEDFTALRDQIDTIANNAEFNGINMINTGGSSVTALANQDASSKITVVAQNLSLSGTIVSVSGASALTTAAAASTMVATLETSLTSVGTALAALGTGAKKLEVHATFIGKLEDSLIAGIGNLVDADLAKESARLQSLQVKQQLGTQALSIANQAPQMFLALFR